MPSPMLTPGMAAAVGNIFKAALPHTCTLTARTPGARSGWAVTSTTPGTPRTGQPCRYVSRTLLTRTDGGYILAVEPSPTGGTAAFVETLMLPAGSDIAVDDEITNIRDLAGRVLLAGPVAVESVMPHAGLGATTLIVAVLRGQTEERLP
jgi:hypothetical protein